MPSIILSSASGTPIQLFLRTCLPSSLAPASGTSIQLFLRTRLPSSLAPPRGHPSNSSAWPCSSLEEPRHAPTLGLLIPEPYSPVSQMSFPPVVSRVVPPAVHFPLPCHTPLSFLSVHPEVYLTPSHDYYRYSISCPFPPTSPVLAPVIVVYLTPSRLFRGPVLVLVSGPTIGNSH